MNDICEKEGHNFYPVISVNPAEDIWLCLRCGHREYGSVVSYPEESPGTTYQSL